MNPNAETLIKSLKNPVKLRVFLFNQLPSAFFSGVRIKELDQNRSVTTVPYKWFSKNPFRSTYFACLAMAAEMSTGVLAMAHTYKSSPTISMLVTKLEANYFKKATGITNFTCEDGSLIESAIEKAIATGEGQTIRAKSTGTNQAGELVAEFFITWSFKARKPRGK